MTVDTNDLISLVANVAFGGIDDPLLEQPFEQLDDFNFWDDDEEGSWLDKGFKLNQGVKTMEFQQLANQSPQQARSIREMDPNIAGGAFKPDRWMSKYENGRIPLKALDPLGKAWPGHEARPDVVLAFRAMSRAMNRDGLGGLLITDSYRDFAGQEAAKDRWTAKGQPSMAATPGTSNHGWGIAFDINVNNPKHYQWLKENGARFGFSQPMSYEPWHWEYHGGYKPAANAFRKKPTPVRSLQTKPRSARAESVSAVEAVGFSPEFSSLTALPFAVAGLMGDMSTNLRLPAPQKGQAQRGGGALPKYVPKRYVDDIRDASRRYGVPASLIAAIIKVESNFNEKATSSAGAQGPMQVMPLHGMDDPYNRRKNIFKGTSIFASYMEAMGGDIRKGLAAYNAGPNNFSAGLDYAALVLEIWRGK